MIILKILLWIFLILIIGSLIASVTLTVKNADAINYTLFNEIYCPGTTTCVLEPNNTLIVPSSGWEYLTYDKNIAKISLDLITRVIQNIPVVPYLENVEFQEIYYISLDSEPFYGIWVTANEIWLSFRGTNSVKEWITDTKVKQLNSLQSKEKYKNTPSFMENNQDIMIHDGFLSIFSEIYENVLEILDYYDPNKEKTICVSGHSLGAAMATIVGLELENIGYTNTYIYSFGSPRIGNLQLKDYYNSLTTLSLFRIINMEDEIPQTPTTVSPNFNSATNPFLYGHFGKVISFSKNAQSLSNNHSLFVYEQNLP